MDDKNGTWKKEEAFAGGNGKRRTRRGRGGKATSELSPRAIRREEKEEGGRDQGLTKGCLGLHLSEF